MLARLRNERFFSLADLNVRISALIEDLNKSGLDQAPPTSEAVKPAPPHGNIRGKTYYQ